MIGVGVSVADAVKRVLYDYLYAEGFREVGAQDASVELQRDDVLLRLSFYEEEPLPHGLNVGLGVRAEDGHADTVGLWAVMPPDVPAQNYALWRFSTTAELETTLVRLRKEVLPIFAAPLWRDRERLDHILERERAARGEAHERQVEQGHLDRARAAFAQGRYESAVDHYVLAGGGHTAADRKRLEMARRGLGPTES